VTEFNYRYRSGDRAMLFVGLETQPGEGTEAAIGDRLSLAGYPVVDLSDNELARTHVRYMIGGPCPDVSDERVLRLEFPERPGALMKFLAAVCPRWNISLFHYRNHGSDYGRVLVGVQVADDELAVFQEKLDELAYPFEEESSNVAYELFLAGSGKLDPGNM
jgi:threonine dehydratase